MYCPQCGTANDDSARFCASCGMDMRQEQAAAQQPPPSRQQGSVHQPGPPPGATYQPGPQGAYTTRPNVPTYIGWGIACLLLCFWPTAIVALVYGGRVNKRLALGDYAGAVDASHKARTWCWVSLAVVIVVIIVAIIASAVTY